MEVEVKNRLLCVDAARIQDVDACRPDSLAPAQRVHLARRDQTRKHVIGDRVNVGVVHLRYDRRVPWDGRVKDQEADDAIILVDDQSVRRTRDNPAEDAIGQLTVIAHTCSFARKSASMSLLDGETLVTRPK